MGTGRGVLIGRRCHFRAASLRGAQPQLHHEVGRVGASRGSVACRLDPTRHQIVHAKPRVVLQLALVDVLSATACLGAIASCLERPRARRPTVEGCPVGNRRRKSCLGEHGCQVAKIRWGVEERAARVVEPVVEKRQEDALNAGDREQPGQLLQLRPKEHLVLVKPRLDRDSSQREELLPDLLHQVGRRGGQEAGDDRRGVRALDAWRRGHIRWRRSRRSHDARGRPSAQDQ